ncbi:MAG: Endonuclease III [Alphaproteobacteria bacterium MarineAlpha9_Bin4]|nr:MAG: Endonuclease III [Alphaproteobacteria bacterium MarineAlpha9_Bin4]|tara:strand:- start:690 stop:1343 length:654 start_codon:yes stop_codon:yes gene_type:complete
MNKRQRINYIISLLEKLYPVTPVPLKHKNKFELLIAVILSAQCTDERVNLVTPKLFKKANNPKKMSMLSINTIYNIIRPCGLAPKKSQAIQSLSKILLEKYNGKVPKSFASLEMLPGVGHKTASVVMSQGFGLPAFPVDTHIHRLAQRWKLTNGKNVKQTEQDLKKIFPEEKWNKLHLQIIFYGREYCSARGCDGTKCNICKTCFPKRKSPIKTKKS